MIIRNAVICKKCGERIESRDIHGGCEKNICSCGGLSVDGGTSCLKRIGDPLMMEEDCGWNPTDGKFFNGKYVIFSSLGIMRIYDRKETAIEVAEECEKLLKEKWFFAKLENF